MIINYNVNENCGVNGAFLNSRSNEAFYPSIEGKIRLIFTLDPINLKNIILVTTTTTNPTTKNIEKKTIHEKNLTSIIDQTDSAITIDYILKQQLYRLQL